MKAYLLIALFIVSSTGRLSKTCPGYSLGPIVAEQCGYAVAVINQVTRNINAVENGSITEQNSAFPKAVANLDSYVKTQVEILTFAPVEFSGAQLSDLSKPTQAAAKKAKIKISVEQRDFAYVLELRGCNLDASSVHFVK